MENLDLLLNEFELFNKKQEILLAIKPAIGIRRIEESEDNIPIGASKLGGSPDLPPHLEFPQYDNGFLTFLAQINLDEAKSFDVDNILPEKGVLYFFYDIIEQPWGFDKEDNGCFKILYFDGENSELTRSNYPEITDEYFPLQSFKMEFFQHHTLPEDPECLDLDEEETDNYWDFRSQVMQPYDEHENAFPAHYMLGEPFNIQNDVFEEIIYYGNEDKYGPDGWKKNELEISAKSNELVLLFQIDSDDDLDVMWGDAGMLYFCINKNDLQAKQFDKVEFILQCY
ncbi:YwqG family protein [Neobacillus sp. WH10]|uniref:YwqG family protein n=1 Tax=Neobacillus sp. WH10 TaxID=3047873 RepID=UPI0024C1E57C|nr:YwqG family protein [Neobacillus sp. WH10]WHY79791.1 YwqG family protein [Neobacillus sp. WH10]